MNIVSLTDLNAFIVRAKARTYAGNAKASFSYRPFSHDIQYHEDNFAYMDSYFGGTDFLGQEVVYFQHKPVWAMNYYGRILLPKIIDSSIAGQIIKTSLSELYKQGRFLGGFEYTLGEYIYTDTNEGTVASFTGQEWITSHNNRAYELAYHGGMILD